jgi:hypothetical protein
VGSVRECGIIERSEEKRGGEGIGTLRGRDKRGQERRCDAMRYYVIEGERIGERGGKGGCVGAKRERGKVRRGWGRVPNVR